MIFGPRIEFLSLINDQDYLLKRSLSLDIKPLSLASFKRPNKVLRFSKENNVCEFKMNDPPTKVGKTIKLFIKHRDEIQ